MPAFAELPISFSIERVGASHEGLLTSLFSALIENGDERFFHPHPLTASHARQLCSESTRDLYFLMSEPAQPLAYGILRGWVAGYTVPSLGIAVHPRARGFGFARLMMDWLHAAARFNGAEQVRLTVEPDNLIARALYESIGYRFGGAEGHENIGYYSLI